MNTSEQINEIAKAMTAAQSEMQNPAFDKKNPAFKSSYASLASCRKAIIPVFAKHGISIVQNIGSTDHGVTCSNLLMHTSGQWIQTDALEVPADRHNAHGYGSACTYARRFSLMALACVVGDEDDDGNQAAANPPSVMQVPLKESGKKITESLSEDLTASEKAVAQAKADEVFDMWDAQDFDGAINTYTAWRDQQKSAEIKGAYWYYIDQKGRGLRNAMQKHAVAMQDKQAA